MQCCHMNNAKKAGLYTCMGEQCLEYICQLVCAQFEADSYCGATKDGGCEPNSRGADVSVAIYG